MYFTTEDIINDYPDVAVLQKQYGTRKYGQLVLNQYFKVYHRTRAAEAQNWRCCFCGIRMVEVSGKKYSVSLEHVVPTSEGGLDEPSNHAASCVSCNNKRGTQDWREFKPQKENPPNHSKVLRKARKRKAQGYCMLKWLKNTRKDLRPVFTELLIKEGII